MKKRHDSPEQIVRKIWEAVRMLGEGQPTVEVCKHLEVTQQPCYRWRNQYRGMKSDDAKRLKELERENQRLKRIVTDQALNIDMLTAVNHIENSCPVSQRRACALVELLRSTQRLNPASPSDFEQALRVRLRELAKARPRFWYRRLHALLVQEWFGVNHKRLQRLRCDESLRVRMQKRKRVCLGQSTSPYDRLRGARPNHVRALDFQVDQTSGCRVSKFLNIKDKFSKETLAIDVERSISGSDVVTILEILINIIEAPEFVRMDTGTEMTSKTISDRCRLSEADISFTDPGSPWQNVYVKSFNSALRDDLRGIEIFANLLEAKIKAEDYREDCYQDRPHSSLGYMTTTEFKQNWHHNNQGLTTVLAH